MKPIDEERARAPEAGPVPAGGRWASTAWAARALRVRLRFLAVIAVGFLVVGRWEVIRTHWDRWTAPAARDSGMSPVSADTEYYCPMDPGVLSGWPGKCPVCRMATVRRSKGDMGPLPSGVIARVQLSPDRVQLAGVRTETIGYRPLVRVVRSVGGVDRSGPSLVVRVEIRGEDARWVEAGQPAEVRPDPPDGDSPSIGTVIRAEPLAGETLDVAIEVKEPSAGLRASRYARVELPTRLADREPFRSMPRGEPPLRPGEPRTIHLCPDHPERVHPEAGRCPEDDRPLEPLPLAKNQRLAWWCPMHPKFVNDRPGATCDACGGMRLVPRVVAYCPTGEVLAVPERAVIDTGTTTVVYLETMPGVFDGVEVRLGPRSGAYYPVVEGLEAGQAVASSGAFLIDAETRLNPALAAGYFGAKRAGAAPPAVVPADRDRSIQQTTCPVTGKRLGSMGEPVRVVVRGRAVFLCCDGCVEAVQSAPEKYLTRPGPARDP